MLASITKRNNFKSRRVLLQNYRKFLKLITMLVVLAYKARLNLYSLQFKRMRSETQGPEGAYKSGCQEDVSPPQRKSRNPGHRFRIVKAKAGRLSFCQERRVLERRK